MAQLGDLIVSGKARFLNEINGQIDWSNVLSKPTTYAPTIGTTATTAMAGNTNVNNVTQTATDSTNSNYEVLFSGTASNTNLTEGVKKTSGFKFNPYGRNLTLEAQSDGAYCSVYPTSISFSASTGNQWSSFGTYNAYLYYMKDETDVRRIDLFANSSEPYNPCIMVQSGDNTGTNFCHMYYTYNDIILSSSGYKATTWDGTNTSLKTAISSLANRKYIYGSWRETSNKTGTGSSHPTIQSFSFTTTGRPLVIILSAPISVSRYTGSIRLIMDNSGILEASTNSQTMFRATNMIIKTDVAAGTHNFVVDLSAQDAGTTTTLYSYNPYSVMMFEL